ncbi:DUF1835 domain-containing protein [Pelagibius litoralis]|uniref:DUF1835 domain-containing protein n=1 Tax=Pelagibius litoralis TaxID=374515 RepID=A0A967K9V2_9PROT|nr:DUF1835 domain-containing protein [Pelagibius litoralis]NIA69524.1 DUF1835 domain-containing protein [Pelagibius litoralis]
MALAETNIDKIAFLPLNPSTEPILHIRCGSDIYEDLREAGIPGSFLEVSDPVCQGPLDPSLSEEVLRRQRADFIAATYHEIGDAAAVLAKLEAEDAGLTQLGRFGKIVLWFEHDLYDQAILIRLLALLRTAPQFHDRLFLINIGAVPGVDRFVGLGQLSPQQLANLWGQEKPVSPAQFDEADRLWRAYTTGDPLHLQEVLQKTDGALPFLVPAMKRHLQELPWRDTGLGLTEQLALKALAEGAETPGRVFALIMENLEPLPYLGDAMFWPLLAGLATAPQPAVTAFSDWRAPLSLTDFGRELLGGRACWTDHNPLDRWIGGLHLKGNHPPYLWDPGAGQAVTNT